MSRENMTQLLRRISPATVAPDLLKRLDAEGAPKEVHLYDVYGVTGKIKEGKSQFGEWRSFRGTFEAAKSDGEIFASNQVFLPQPYEDLLYTLLMKTQETDEKASIEFAVRVSIVPPTPGKASSTGYEYRCIPIIDDRTSSPLLSLREKVQAATKQLAAPAAEVKDTPPAIGARRR